MCNNPWKEKIEQLKQGNSNDKQENSDFKCVSLNEGFNMEAAYFSSNNQTQKKEQD